MPFFSSLPQELHTLILELLPTSDVLQLRLLDHRFHQRATDFIFPRITIDLSRVDKLFEVVAVYAGVLGSRFPARDILMDTTFWGLDEQKITLGMGTIAALLPHLLDLTKARLCLQERDNLLKENHLTIIGRFIRLPSLAHLQIVGNLPLLPSLFSGSNLSTIEFKHQRLDHGHNGGLECIFLLLDVCHHLCNLEIHLTKATFNGQQLHFIDYHLTHETRYVNMEDLRLTLLGSDQDVPDAIDLVHVFTFFMPNLKSLYLALGSYGSNRITRRAQASSDIASSMPRVVATNYPRLALRLGLRRNLLDDFLAQLPRSLASALDINLYGGALPVTLLSGMTSLIDLAITRAMVNSMVDVFAAMPAAARLKTLSLSHCEIDSPVTLERGVLMLPSLSSIHLNFVNFTTRLTRPHDDTIENPWISLLCSFFERHQARPDAFLTWYSLPVSTALYVSAFETDSTFDDINERVCILLQDEQRSVGKNVRVWHCGRDYYDRVDEQIELDNDEATAVLSKLAHELGMGQTGADEHVLLTDPAVDAFSLIHNEWACTVYACTSVKKMEFTVPDFEDD